uniref:15-hydroxyprostaglandin dehydrogenase [NAD(+)] n=1 Tax=Eptatretus burgeri TaxID=7764 RepID=A0A8C4QMC2_EPTBU
MNTESFNVGIGSTTPTARGGQVKVECSMSLSGSTALVTGAAQGLGAALVDALLRRGAKVALLDILEEEVKSKAAELEELYGAGRTLAIHCDVTSTDFEKSFEKVKEHFGSLTIVINNAGILNEQEWEKMISINLLAVVNGTELAVKHMEKDSGVVVNVSSILGLEAFSLCPVYTASKYGVLGFSRARAALNKKRGVKVRVNVLCPSVTDTPMIQTAFTAEGLASTPKNVPIFKQFFGDEKLEPRTVAEACMRLVEDKSLNGSALKVALLDILEEEVKSKAAELEQLYGAGRTLAIHCDVTSTDFEKSFEKVKEHFGSLTIVINNAGIMNEQEWEKMISINLLAVINGTKLAMKHMEKDGGVVVNVSSVVGLEAFSFCPVYTASKHGVLGFSRALAALNKEQGVKVRVNVLCPSVVDTPLLQTAFTPERLGSTFDILPIVHQLIGDEKLEPRTVAEACMRLVEDKSLNGSALKVVASMETELVQFPKILSK